MSYLNASQHHLGLLEVILMILKIIDPPFRKPSHDGSPFCTSIFRTVAKCLAFTWYPFVTASEYWDLFCPALHCEQTNTN